MARKIEANLIHADLSRGVIGAAMEVSNRIGPGLREMAYERALCLRLETRNISYSQQKRFDVLYNGHIIDTLVPDLLIGGLIIVDLKVVSPFDESHEAQMLTYLQITSLQLALLLNFKRRKLGWKRIVR